MTHHDKAVHVAKMIEEMMDLKLREHDRRHHPGPDANFPHAIQRGLEDQNRLRAIQVNLPDAIADLLTG
jgi:hypothetical protein